MAPDTAKSSTIFVSYQRSDSEFVVRLGADLRSRGVDIWLDQLDIRSGEQWDDAVEETLSDCGRLLVVLSPASVDFNTST